MAPPQQLRQQISSCSLLLIYRPRKDERLSWPSWLTYSGWFTHISGHPSATQVERKTAKARRPKTDVLPLDHATIRPIVIDEVAWSVCHDRELFKNDWTDRDAIWGVDSVGPKESCIRRGLDPHAKRQFWGRKWRFVVKYRNCLPWAVQNTDVPIEMRFVMLSRVGRSMEPCIR